MTPLTFFSATLLTAAIALPLCAEAQPRGGGRDPVDMLMRADRNGDGAVTLAELNSARAAMFARLDRNQDGQISGQELRGRLAGLDADGDGVVTAAEFNARPAPLFERFDANADSLLDATEIATARAAMAERGARQGGQRNRAAADAQSAPGE